MKIHYVLFEMFFILYLCKLKYMKNYNFNFNKNFIHLNKRSNLALSNRPN
jgi:hypothetical protein